MTKVQLVGWLVWVWLMWLSGCRTDTTSTADRITFPPNKTPTASGRKSAANVPVYVSDVWLYVQQHHRPPDGYVGGRTFGNYERHLPIKTPTGRRIRYQEWDVHPKRNGKNRGAERLITGSDQRAYYTRDHYNHFIELK